MKRPSAKVWVALGVATVALVGILWFGLRRQERIEFERAPGPPRAPSTVPYTNFWDALRNGDLPAAETRSAGADEERRLLAAFRALRSRHEDAAWHGLERLAGSGSNQRVREVAGGLLRELAWASERWPWIVERRTAFSSEQASAAGILKGSPTPTVEISGKAEAELLLDWVHVPRIRVMLRGKSRVFVLDSGSAASAIALDAARDSGLAGPQAEPAAVTADLQIVTGGGGTALLRAHPLIVTSRTGESLAASRADGILGWPLFRRLRIELDSASRRVRFEPSTPVVSEGSLFWLGRPLVAAQTREGVSLYWVLDTGSPLSSVAPAAFHKIGAHRDPDPKGIEALRDFAFVLHPFQVRFPRIPVERRPRTYALEPDGVLGADFWEGRRVAIDYPRGRFEVEMR